MNTITLNVIQQQQNNQQWAGTAWQWAAQPSGVLRMVHQR